MWGESVTIIRPTQGDGSLDEQGNPIPGDPQQIVSSGWAVAPATTAESSQPFAQQIISGYTLYKRDFIEDVRTTDRILVRGREWAVSGQVGDWENPATRFRGTVVNVKAVG